MKNFLQKKLALFAVLILSLFAFSSLGVFAENLFIVIETDENGSLTDTTTADFNKIPFTDGQTWADVKDTANTKVKANEGYKLDQWVNKTIHALTVVNDKDELKNRIYTATFKTIHVTVTFDADNGTEKVIKTINNGDVAVAPTTVPTKAADATNTYVFQEWKLGDVKYEFTEPVTTNITLKAAYTATPKTVTVTFDADNETSPDIEIINNGGVAKVPTTVPTKAADATHTYVFKQWELTAGTAYDFTKPVTENITIKAAYTATPKTPATPPSGTSSSGWSGGARSNLYKAVKTSANTDVELRNAKIALGEKTKILDDLAKIFLQKDRLTQKKVKALLEVFKKSVDAYTRNVGIYLSSVVK